MRIETEKVYKLVKKYGGVLTDDRHFMDDVDKLFETAHNSDYAKCPCCGEPWNIKEHESCQCGAFIKKRGSMFTDNGQECKHERGSMVTDNGQEWFVCKHCHKKYERYF